MNFDNMPGVGGSATLRQPRARSGATEKQPVYNSTHEFTKMMNELEVAKAKDFSDRRRAERRAKRAGVNKTHRGGCHRSRGVRGAGQGCGSRRGAQGGARAQTGGGPDAVGPSP